MKINIGILGAGNIAREHIRVLKDFKQFNIVGIVGRGKKNINKTKKKFPQIIFYKSLKDLFRNKKINLLIICINEHLVIKNYKEILKYNCIFLFEKPLGINFLETKKIYNYSNTYKKKIFISLNRRFYSSTLLGYKFLKNTRKVPLNIFINDSQDIPRIRRLGLSERLAKNLMYCNSIHLLDYINIFIKDKIFSIKNIIKFQKKNPEYVLSYIKFFNGHRVIYKANWKYRESWQIKISSKKINLIFKPLENITVYNPKNLRIKKNYDYYDKKYKPGLYNQSLEILKYFKGENNNLVTFKMYFESVKIVKKIYEN